MHVVKDRSRLHRIGENRVCGLAKCVLQGFVVVSLDLNYLNTLCPHTRFTCYNLQDLTDRMNISLFKFRYDANLGCRKLRQVCPK